MRVATWNLERRKPTAPRGAEAIDYLASLSAEIVVATEARTTMSLGEGHAVWPDPPRGSRFAEDERKIVLWASCPFERIQFDSPIDPTRFVAVRAQSSIGPVVVLGACITWHMAEVTYHTGPKKKPWEEHFDYLEHLKPIMDSIDEPLIVAGDFNQRVPRAKGASVKAAEAMQVTFAGLDIVTAGVPEGCARQGIDHIALGGGLRATSVRGWPNDITGNRLSDHDGAMVEVRFG